MGFLIIQNVYIKGKYFGNENFTGKSSARFDVNIDGQKYESIYFLF